MDAQVIPWLIYDDVSEIDGGQALGCDGNVKGCRSCGRLGRIAPALPLDFCALVVEQQIYGVSISWTDTASFDALPAWCCLITLRCTVSLTTQDAPDESQGGCHAQSGVECSGMIVTYPASTFSAFSTCLKLSQSLSRHRLWGITPHLMMACLWWGVSYFRVGLTDANLSPRYTIVCKPCPASRRLDHHSMQRDARSRTILLDRACAGSGGWCSQLQKDEPVSIAEWKMPSRWALDRLCRRTAPALLQRSSSTTSIRTIGPHIAVTSLKSPRKHLATCECYMQSIGSRQVMTIERKRSHSTQSRRTAAEVQCALSTKNEWSPSPSHPSFPSSSSFPFSAACP